MGTPRIRTAARAAEAPLDVEPGAPIATAPAADFVQTELRREARVSWLKTTRQHGAITGPLQGWQVAAVPTEQRTLALSAKT